MQDIARLYGLFFAREKPVQVKLLSTVHTVANLIKRLVSAYFSDSVKVLYQNFSQAQANSYQIVTPSRGVSGSRRLKSDMIRHIFQVFREKCPGMSGVKSSNRHTLGGATVLVDADITQIL